MEFSLKNEIDFEDFKKYFTYYPITLSLRETSRLKYLKHERLIPPILDLGCGDGFFTSQLDNKLETWGIDYSGAEISRAKKRNIYANLIEGDVKNANLPHNYFNTCIANCSLEHMAGLQEILKNVQASLKKNALFYIIVPPKEWEKDFYSFQLLNLLKMDKLHEKYRRKMNAVYKNENLYSLNEWKEILLSFGLETTKHFYLAGKGNNLLCELFLIPGSFGIKLRQFTGKYVLFPSVRNFMAKYVFFFLNSIYRLVKDVRPVGELVIICKKIYKPEFHSDNSINYN